MTTYLQDLRFAVRQLRKSPGFTLTVLLTLALGIGANAAIFTLVNAVLLKNLPVSDPRALIRLGDHPDCCVGTGLSRNGDVSIFATESYEQIRKNAPEFEELAAMQAGFGYLSLVTARRDGDSNLCAVGDGRVCVRQRTWRMLAFRPAAGRLLTDGDDVASAPMTAVMSYNHLAARLLQAMRMWLAARSG